MALPIVIPDLRTIPLEDVVAVIRQVPLTNWILKQLDDMYLSYFMKAKTDNDFERLRGHISYILTYFIPMRVVGPEMRNGLQDRWALLADLALVRSKQYKDPPAAGSPEQAVLVMLASRESTEISLTEPLTDDQRGSITGLVDKGLVERIPMHRPHPLKPHEYTLCLTDLGRAALPPKES